MEHGDYECPSLLRRQTALEDRYDPAELREALSG